MVLAKVVDGLAVTLIKALGLTEEHVEGLELRLLLGPPLRLTHSVAVAATDTLAQLLKVALAQPLLLITPEAVGKWDPLIDTLLQEDAHGEGEIELLRLAIVADGAAEMSPEALAIDADAQPVAAPLPDAAVVTL